MRASQAEKAITKAEATKRISEKAARAEKAAKIWDNHPLFKGELSKLKEAKARQNAAIHLTNQARFMKQLNEQETSAEFQRMAPAHIMRLVQLTMTNLNRGNVFSEYAMETARDAIYYIKPYFSKSVASDDTFATRSMSYGGDEADPFGFGKDAVEDTTIGGYNGKDKYYGGAKHARNGSESKLNARKSIYESAESRFANELANVASIATTKIVEGEVTPLDTIEIVWAGGEFGENGENYVPGSTKIYAGTDELDVIAFQDPNTFGYYVGQDYKDIVATITETGNKTTIRLVEGGSLPAKINAYARFESENDIEGKHIGEVNLFMSVYELRPRRTSIGVSWTKLAEITLDSTFNTQVDDLLLSSAADVIHGQLDLQAFKDAYAISKTNPKSYCIEFDAKGKATEAPKSDDATMFTYSLDSYVATANTFASAIELAGAALYTDIKRGAINKLVVGVSVAPYLKLMAGFVPTGLQTPAGVYRIGELDGIEVYKAPVEVIPHDEVLCVFKNEKVENDVALVYGTLVPFVSSKLEYPTFYTRAGLASFGDKAILNPKYLARIVVKNLKDELKLDA